ncbi:MAG: hypothetical protein JW934_18715, partial [Anaerolineae bacterium]|nr:hypothetical protein [Anaerolineae bacterium]
MQLARFYHPDLGACLAAVREAKVYDLSAAGQPELDNLSALIEASVERPIVEWLHDIDWARLPVYDAALFDHPPLPGAPHWLPPVDRQEVWAAGVTYAWSREARVREATSKEIYVKVYE